MKTSTKSRPYLRFIEKMVDKMDLTLKEAAEGSESVEFENSTTQLCWASFQLGWSSHPSEHNLNKEAFIIGRDLGDRIQFSENPSLHCRYWSVSKELEFLTKKHGGKFAVFFTRDQDIVTRATEKMNQRRKQRLERIEKEMKDLTPVVVET